MHSNKYLCPGVDDVDLVQGDDVDDLLPLLQLPLGALHKLCGCACEPRAQKTWVQPSTPTEGTLQGSISLQAACIRQVEPKRC